MRILNKRASFNYQIVEKFEAGIVLTGSEAKAVKMKGADINHAFVRIKDGEGVLINANITSEVDSTRERKLLLRKEEIVSLDSKSKAKKLTLVPTKMYNRGSLIKVEIALAKPKREFEKREVLKKRDVAREVERELKER